VKTSPALDQTKIVCSYPKADVLFAVLRDYEGRGSKSNESMLSVLHDNSISSPFCSSFHTIDVTNYNIIHSVELERNIIDLAIDKNENFVVVIENSPSALDSICRVYEIGRKRADADEDSDYDADNGDCSSSSDDDGDDDSMGSLRLETTDDEEVVDMDDIDEQDTMNALLSEQSDENSDSNEE